MTGPKGLWEFFSKGETRFITQVKDSGVPEGGSVRKVVFGYQCGRATFKPRPANWMRVPIIFLTNLFQRGLKHIAKRDSLTDVDVAQWIEMDPPRLAQIFMRTGIESFPGMAGRAWGKFFHRPAAIHDRAFVFDLPMRLIRDRVRLRNADHACWDVQPLRRNERVLRAIAQSFTAMEQVTAHCEICKPARKRAQPFL